MEPVLGRMVVAEDAGPAELAGQRESIGLVLSPVVILLDRTVASVNGALQRAREAAVPRPDGRLTRSATA